MRRPTNFRDLAERHLPQMSSFSRRKENVAVIQLAIIIGLSMFVGIIIGRTFP